MGSQRFQQKPDSSRAFLKKRRKKDCTLWIYLSAGELPFFDTAHTGNQNSVVSAIFVVFSVFFRLFDGAARIRSQYVQYQNRGANCFGFCCFRAPGTDLFVSENVGFARFFVGPRSQILVGHS